MVCEILFGLVCLVQDSRMMVSPLQGSSHGYQLDSEYGRARFFVSDFIADPDVSRMVGYCAETCAFVAGACTEEYCEYYVSVGDKLSAVRVAVYGSPRQREAMSKYIAIVPSGGFFPLNSIPVEAGRLSLP